MHKATSEMATLLRGVRIVIVNDSDFELEPLRNLLASCGAHVETVSGPDAMDSIHRERPALLIRRAGVSSGRALADAAAGMRIEQVTVTGGTETLDASLCRIFAALVARAS